VFKVSIISLYAVGVCGNAHRESIEACSEGECANDDLSLMALRKSGLKQQQQASPGVVHCTNSHGAKYLCAYNNTCCGDVCAGPGSVCCRTGNAPGFPCAPGNKCCGNTCQAPGSKCCRSQMGHTMDYAVTEDTECSSHVSCTNSRGAKFQCAANNTCCGDVCAGPGSVCCHTGSSPGFPCAPGNKCCGNTCQAPGSRCCRSKGMDYPVTDDTKCAGWELGSRPCVNRYGVSFWCGRDSTCCGDICAGAGSSCCQNQYGNDFVCAPGSKCGRNVCLAATGSSRRGKGWGKGYGYGQRYDRGSK